jgi:hypothetical protein
MTNEERGEEKVKGEKRREEGRQDTRAGIDTTRQV